jgi:cobalt transporter subunit CbtA
MNALRSILFVAALAGLAAGVAMTLMQFFATVPLILEAETFETAAAVPHDHGAGAVEPHDHGTGVVAPHDHGDGEEWAPADGFPRMSLTAAANLVTAIGFGLLLVAASEFAGGIASWRQGLVWGLAGFAVFTLAPGLGLPPELPGMPAAELGARQGWWIATVVLTAGGLALIAFGRGAWIGVAGAALLVLPHLVGAPQPVSHETAVPSELHHRFVVAVTVTNLVFWLALGLAVSLVRPRFAADLAPPRARLA